VRAIIACAAHYTWNATILGVLSANRKPPLVCKRNLPKDRSAILTDRGSSAQLASFASSLFGVGLFMGRVGCGYLLDQFLAPRVAALLFSAGRDRDCISRPGPRYLVCVHRGRTGRSRYSSRGRHYCVFDEPLLWRAPLWSDFWMDLGSKGHSSCFAFLRVRDQVEFFWTSQSPSATALERLL